MSKRFFGLFILAGLLLPVVARASTIPISPEWEFTSASGGTGGNYTFGIVFTANQNIWINYLGYYYKPTSGMSNYHPVGLFDDTLSDPGYGTLLASTIVNSGSSYSSANFLYNAIAPVELLAGDTYLIEGVTYGDPWAYLLNGNSNPLLTVNPNITILGANFQSGTGSSQTIADLSFDSADGSTTYYFGPDMGLTPEPNSLWLLGSGLAGLAGLIKRKLMAQ
jgi:hypothetical protein